MILVRAVLPIPETAEHLTPEWLTAALTAAGVLRRGRVSSARWQRIGQEHGFTGVVGRVELGYENEDGNPPASLIAKLPMARDDAVSGYRALQESDPDSIDRYYERCAREERFYLEIAVAFAPRRYYSAVDDVSRRVVLLLEDLSSGRQGDVLHGCSVDEAALVIKELAPFHARYLGERAITLGFPRWGGDPQARQTRYEGHVDRFLKEYGDSLPRDVCSIIDRLRSRLAAVARALCARRHALIHADLHLDNLIFDARGGGRSVVVLDWQTVSVGSPAWDLALFLVGSLSVEDRRGAEAELLDQYVTLLSAHGVRGYSVDELRLEFGLALLVLLAGTVGWLTTPDRDELTARERALQHAALTDGRLIAALVDHEVGALLAEPLPA